MTEVQLFSVEYLAQLILSGKGVFVREITLPRHPEYSFRVLENPKFSDVFLPVTEKEVRYFSGYQNDPGDDNCKNKENFKKLLTLIDQMRSKQSPHMEGKVVERQQALER